MKNLYLVSEYMVTTYINSFWLLARQHTQARIHSIQHDLKKLITFLTMCSSKTVHTFTGIITNIIQTLPIVLTTLEKQSYWEKLLLRWVMYEKWPPSSLIVYVPNNPFTTINFWKKNWEKINTRDALGNSNTLSGRNLLWSQLAPE